MLRKLFAATIVLTLISFHATALTCDRKSYPTQGFKSQAAADSWFPKRINLPSSDFKPKGKLSKQMLYSIGEFNYSLLPNGKLIVKIRPRHGYISVAPAYYKCDLNAIELRELIEKNPSPKKTKVKSNSASNTDASNNNKCSMSMLKSCSNEEVCEKGTKIENNSRVWAESGYKLKYANEAKSRALSCDIISSVNNGSNSNIQNAEKKCSEIGYTKGTEKYADCVMKLMN